MRRKKIVIVVALFLILLLGPLGKTGGLRSLITKFNNQSLKEIAKSADHKNVLLFISTHDYGCDCMMDNSKLWESAIKQVLTETGSTNKVFYTNIPYFSNKQFSDRIMKVLRIKFVPAVVFLDGNLKVRYQTAYDFNYAEVSKLEKVVVK